MSDMRGKAIAKSLFDNLHIDMWHRLLSYTNKGVSEAFVLLIFVALAALSEMAMLSFFIVFLGKISPDAGNGLYESGFVFGFINNMLRNFDAETASMVIIAIILSLASIRETLRYHVVIINRKGVSAIELNIRRKLVSDLLRADYLSTDLIGSGAFTELIGLKAVNSGKLYTVVAQLSNLVFTVCSYLFVVSLVSPFLAAMAVCLTFVFMLVMNKPIRLKKELAEKNVMLTIELSKLVERIYTLRRSIKVDNLNSQQSNMSHGLASKIYEFAVAADRAGAAISGVLIVALLLVLLISALVLFVNGLIDLVLLSTGLIMLMRVMPLMLSVNRIRAIVANYSPSFNEIEKNIRFFQHKKEALSGHLVMTNKPKSIKIHDLSYRYHGSDDHALKKINFRLNAGEVVALVGASGAGKSTLADLITRTYGLQDGKILIDSHEINDIAINGYRSAIAYYPQDAAIFDGTVAYNLKLRNANASDDDIKKVLIATDLLTYMDSLPEGLETLLGTEGLKLSGGQRQRLALCSILLKDAPILVLDEPTSALDAANSQSLVRHIIATAKKNKKIVLVISHNWDVVSQFDRMIKLKEGSIVHDSLPVYFDE